jgi:hypothetical protein
MQIEISVYSNSPLDKLLSDMMGPNTHAGATKIIMPNILLLLNNTIEQEGSTPSHGLVFHVQATAGEMPVDELSKWLFDNFKGRISKLMIDGTQVGIDKEEIALAVRRKT